MELPELEFGVRSADAGDGVYVVGVRGELDLYTAPELESELCELLARGAVRLIVDLSAVTFVDSTTVAMLAGIANALEARVGALILVTDSPSTTRVLKITGVDRIVALRRSLADALVEAEHTLRRKELA